MNYKIPNHSYRYNNSIYDIEFRYIYQTKKDNGVIQKSVKVGYYKMIDLLELKDTNDDLGISYQKATTRQLQKIQMTLLRTKDLNIIKCNVYVNNQVIL